MTTLEKEILQTLFEFCAEKDFQHPHMIIAAELLREDHEMNIQKYISIDDVKKIVYDYFNTTQQQVEVKSRKRELVKVRQIAMVICYDISEIFKLGWTLEYIGQNIAHRDHGTVMHARKTVANLRDTERIFDKDYKAIKYIVLSNIHSYGQTTEITDSEESERVRQK